MNAPARMQFVKWHAIAVEDSVAVFVNDRGSYGFGSNKKPGRKFRLHQFVRTAQKRALRRNI